MSPILAIAAKDLRLLLRDRVGAFFVFVFPALIGVFFGLIFSGGGDGPSGIGVIVVDEDHSEDSISLVESLADGETLSLTPYDDWDAAIDAVRRGERPAAIRIAPGFGDNLLDLSPDSAATIDLAIDPSQSFQRGVIEGLVTQAAFQQLTTSFTDPAGAMRLLDKGRDAVAQADDLSPIERLAFTQFFGGLESLIDGVMVTPAPEPAPGAPPNDGAASDPGATAANADGSRPTDAPEPPAEATDEEPFEFRPIRVNTSDVTAEQNFPPNSFSWTFPQANAWALLGCVMGFTASLVLERSRGTMTRLRLAPLSVAQMLAGKCLACFAAAVFVQLLLLTLAVVFFGVRPQSPPLVALTIVVGAAAFTGIAMLISVIGKTEQSAMGIAQATMLILALGGGAGVPLFIMPGWIQTAASVSPFKWLIMAQDGAIWRGFDLADIALPLGVLLGLGAACFVAGAVLFTTRWSKA
jgi:ABC-2 type transport system permease protein